MSEADFHSRYPGTSPFDDSPGDVSRFFGREREAEELYLRVLSVPLLVQFGASGLGKTSLLQAGLFPRLRTKPFLPVMIRLNNPEDSLIDSVVRSVQKSCETEGLKFTPEDRSGLPAFLSTTIFRDDLLLTPVLVFDQFEEVFTLRDAAFRSSLASELGALARRPNLKIVISLREDYVGALEELSGAIPGLFQERLRLKPFSEESARDAVTQPALLENSFASPRFELDPAALDALIRDLRGRSGIEPIQLQLLCRQAEAIARSKRSGNGIVRLTLDDFRGRHSFDSVLRNFYRDTLQKISPHSQRKNAARLCEEGLLGSDGHRLMLEERQVFRDYNVCPETLHVLTQEKLVRREQRLESVFYEISHDRLAESIFNARPRRLSRSVKRFLWITGAAAALFFGVLLLFSLSEKRARESAEQLIGFLLGEQFLGEVRDMGSSTLLQQLQKELDRGGEFEDRPALLQGLNLRNHGDVKRLQGDVAAAERLYAEAVLTLFRDPDDADTRREAARALERWAGSLDDQRKLKDALVAFEKAVESWRRVIAGVDDPETRTDDCISLADATLGMGFLRDRLGQGDIALKDAEGAVDAIFNVLFGVGKGNERCRPVPGKADPWPDAGALNVLSRAALLRGIILDTPEDFDGAVILAKEANALIPSSTSARKYSLQVFGWRAYTQGEKKPQLALDDCRYIQKEAEELRRWDPDNRQWQRERAMSQQLMARGIASCHRNQACSPLPPPHDAEAMVLDAVATFRALAQLDPNNQALEADIFWALLELADVLAVEQDRAADRVEVLEEAGRVLEKLESAGTDVEITAMGAYLLQYQADASYNLGRTAEAAESLQKSIEVWKELGAEHPKHPLYARELSAEAVTNPNRSRAADWDEYGRVRNDLYRKLAQSHDRGEQATLLNAMLQSAQIAAWLAPETVKQRSRGDLLIARSTFAAFLQQHNRPEEALAMRTEEVVVAEALVHDEPESAYYQFRLGLARCDIGSLRRQLKQAGWEEAIRSGIIHIRRSTALDPALAHQWSNLGRWRAYLGKELIAEGRRNDGIAQLSLALADYRRAGGPQNEIREIEALLPPATP